MTTIAVQVDREGEQASLALTGSFDLEHAVAADRALQDAEEQVSGCRSVDVDLGGLERMDGSGALLLARLLARLNSGECRTHVVERQNLDAARLIALYCEHHTKPPSRQKGPMGQLARLGALAAGLPAKARDALDFTGRCAISLPKAIAAPNSVDWRSLPRLLQEIGADGLPVTSAANLLVGVIIGLLGVSQLGRFGAIAYVPELVVVAHFRELGPLVTAIVVAGRSGAGIASEIATMKVSEEIDALRSLGFDPVRWLVVPRCLALVATVPLLTWVGDALVIVGGLAATILTTHMTPHAYLQATLEAITMNQLLVGLIKSPFLALAIGLIACGQGLLARGGASAVGARTTSAVVMAILSVIVVSAVFTFFFAFLGV